jgi:hypothetical protein
VDISPVEANQAPAPYVAPSFADTLPETMDETFPGELPVDDDVFAPVTDQPSDEQRVERKERKKRMSKEMRDTMAAFQQMFTDSVGEWFNNQALTSGREEWNLDEKDKKTIDNAVKFVFTSLGIEIAIEPIDVKLESKWWLILYPLAAFGFVFYRKQTAVKKASTTDAT